MTTTAARAKAHKPFVPSREDLADIREVARLAVAEVLETGRRVKGTFLELLRAVLPKIAATVA